MKNIVFAVFSLFLMMPAVMADCNTPVTISYVGNQEPDDNEFLYESEREYLLAKQGYTNSGKKNSGDGHAYECDFGRSGGCGHDDVVTMDPGHVFKGQVIDKEVKYQCNATRWMDWDDYWVVVEDGVCHTKGFGDVAVGNCVPGDGGCKKLTDIDCSGYNKTDILGVEFKGVCFEGPLFKCVATKCRGGMTADANGICSGDVEKPDDKKDDKRDDKKDDRVVVGKCHPSVCTSELCKACCAKPGTETIWTPSVNKCVCVNGGNFVKENNDWVCKTVTAIVPEKYKCDSVLMAKMSAWKDRCSQFSDVLTEITALEKYCAGKPDKDIFLRLYDELKDNVDNTCVKPVADDNDGNATVVIGIAKTRIQNAVSSLQLFVGGLDVSKWKDREGDFNTARLASDSIAGVVLGTAGGLITSSVVKKHQVEDGFEDLQCTIGGQTVANWGDEFQVGVR